MVKKNENTPTVSPRPQAPPSIAACRAVRRIAGKTPFFPWRPDAEQGLPQKIAEEETRIFSALRNSRIGRAAQGARRRIDWQARKPVWVATRVQPCVRHARKGPVQNPGDRNVERIPRAFCLVQDYEQPKEKTEVEDTQRDDVPNLWCLDRPPAVNSDENRGAGTGISE